MKKLMVLSPTNLDITLAEKVSDSEVNHYKISQYVFAIQDTEARAKYIKEIAEKYFKEEVEIDWSSWETGQDQVLGTSDVTNMLNISARIFLRSLPKTKEMIVIKNVGLPVYPKGESFSAKIEFLMFKISEMLLKLAPKKAIQNNYVNRIIKDLIKDKGSLFDSDFSNSEDLPVKQITANPFDLLVDKLTSFTKKVHSRYRTMRSIYKMSVAGISFSEEQEGLAFEIMSDYIAHNKDNIVSALSEVQTINLADTIGDGKKRKAVFFFHFLSGSFAQNYKKEHNDHDPLLRIVSDNEYGIGLTLTPTSEIKINTFQMEDMGLGSEFSIFKGYKVTDVTGFKDEGEDQ